jgi:hypothetical protein
MLGGMAQIDYCKEGFKAFQEKRKPKWRNS